jgi:hypothetical protein
MNANARCEVCHRSFALSGAQRKLVESAQKKGQAFIMVECSECGMATRYVPEGSAVQPTKETPAPYRCPVPHCAGWASYVEDKGEGRSFWGCGECGSVWFDKKNLFRDIDAITKRFPYRKKSYIKQGTEWLPADPSKEDPRYEDRVEQEPADTHQQFERG